MGIVIPILFIFYSHLRDESNLTQAPATGKEYSLISGLFESKVHVPDLNYHDLIPYYKM